MPQDQDTKAKDPDGDDTGSDEAKEGDEEDSIFIPLGLAYELPRQYYKGSDPEWQSFIKLANDKQRCNYLKSTASTHKCSEEDLIYDTDELTGLVGRYAGSHPTVQKVIGKNNKPKQYWLYMDFPDGPPPEYERKGFAAPHLIDVRIAHNMLALRLLMITSLGPLSLFILSITEGYRELYGLNRWRLPSGQATKPWRHSSIPSSEEFSTSSLSRKLRARHQESLQTLNSKTCTSR